MSAAESPAAAPQTPWLTDDQQRIWRSWLSASSRVPARLGHQLQQDSGLSLQDYEVLVTLNEAPGGSCRITELATMLEWERSRMSHHLNRMDKRGLIRRYACPDDGRAQLVELTDNGHVALEKAAPGHVNAVRSVLFDALSDRDAAELGRITALIAAHLDNQSCTLSGKG
ncbi:MULTISPECIES: MarR family winged helix-turn-helix transcriptional regulator [Kocuria]|uniref:MarR family transcriptional regulator n=1 Tax=Kocuria subflava TaxID=1736139 RepID=A0A846TWP7_9MICC|nr:MULTISPECIES: MarR family transcriptional regulator [Kocuria]NKE10172.1 MarR family transcriptional regulator [Kocuria subflava]